MYRLRPSIGARYLLNWDDLPPRCIGKSKYIEQFLNISYRYRFKLGPIKYWSSIYIVTNVSVSQPLLLWPLDVGACFFAWVQILVPKDNFLKIKVKGQVPKSGKTCLYEPFSSKRVQIWSSWEGWVLLATCQHFGTLPKAIECYIYSWFHNVIRSPMWLTTPVAPIVERNRL